MKTHMFFARVHLHLSREFYRLISLSLTTFYRGKMLLFFSTLPFVQLYTAADQINTECRRHSTVCSINHTGTTLLFLSLDLPDDTVGLLFSIFSLVDFCSLLLLSLLLKACVQSKECYSNT
jgi:hypothetical protein